MGSILRAVAVVLIFSSSALGVFVETETNDSMGAADPISIDAVTGANAGLLSMGSGGTDVDYLEVSMGAGGILTAIAVPMSDNFEEPDTIMALFDANGEQLVFDDDSGNEDDTYGSAIMFQAIDPGSYYIGVTGYNNDYDFSGVTHGKTGSYLLTVSTVPSSPSFVESELNDSILTADPVPGGAGNPWAIAGPMYLDDGGTDVDYFEIHLEAGQTFTAAASPLSDPFDSPDTSMALFDSAGGRIVLDDDSANDGESYGAVIMYEATAAGDYYLAVTGYEGDFAGGEHGESGGYLLTIAELTIPGDVNLSGCVDDDDLSLLLANWNVGTTWGEGDLDASETVDDDDLSLLLANWGIGCSSGAAAAAAQAVPEPATLALLVIGAAGLLRRRK